MAEVCFSNVTFQAIQQRLEDIRLDTNQRKDMQRDNIKALRSVLASQNVGLGALLIPDREGQDFYAYWDHIPRTQAIECRDLQNCTIPTGEEVQSRKQKFQLQHCIESEVITINETRYLKTPVQLEMTLAKQITDRILALENKANEIMLQFLYDNRGVNDYEYDGLVALTGNDTYFTVGSIANPDNLAYLVDFIDYMNIGRATILDGGALNKAILLSRFNAADDDKRSQFEKWNELTDGVFENYVNDIRGTGTFLRNISDTKHPDGIKRGYFVIENGAVSFLSKHNYPALANPEELSTASQFFNTVGIGNFAKQFGQSGQPYDTSSESLNYAIPSLNLTQTFVPAEGGDPVTLPVYIDVEHDIVCHRDTTTHARGRIHNIMLRLKFGIFLAPTGIDADNTGIFLLSENCNANVLDVCETDLCSIVCDDLAVAYEVVGNSLVFEANPVTEYCEVGDGSGYTITNQTIQIYRVINGSALGQLITSLSDTQLNTSQIVTDLIPGEQYTIVATAIYDDGVDGTCTKTAQHCVTMPTYSGFSCEGVEASVTLVDGDIVIAITNVTDEDITEAVTSYNLVILQGADAYQLGSGDSSDDFPLALPVAVDPGAATVFGVIVVAGCTLSISQAIVVPVP